MSSPSPPPPTVPDDADADADLPLTMAASVVLTALPRDAKSALEGAGELVGVEKG
jgi:ubiquitin-like protein ATG12